MARQRAARHGVVALQVAGDARVHPCFRVAQQAGQGVGLHVVQGGVALSAAVEEDAVHAHAPVPPEALLHEAEAGPGRQVVVEVADIVPHVDVRHGLPPVCHQLGKGFGLLALVEVRFHRQLHGADEDARVRRQRVARRLARGQVGRDEEAVAGESFGQALRQLCHGGRGVLWRVAGAAAGVAGAGGVIVVRGYGHAGALFVAAVVQYVRFHRAVEGFGREAQLRGVLPSVDGGLCLRRHAVGQGRLAQVVPPDEPVVVRVVGAVGGHLRGGGVAGRVQAAVFEGGRAVAGRGRDAARRRLRAAASRAEEEQQEQRVAEARASARIRSVSATVHRCYISSCNLFLYSPGSRSDRLRGRSSGCRTCSTCPSVRRRCAC